MKNPVIKTSILTIGVLLLLLAISMIAGCGEDDEGTPEPSPSPTITETPTPNTSPASTDKATNTPSPTPEVTDEEINNAVEWELVFDGAVDTDNIDVETYEGIVNLTGHVDNILAKDRATRIAEMVKGVRSVSNRIDVISMPTRSDAQIQEDVETALFRNPATENFEIDVTVNDNVVTLSGEAESWYEAELCVKVAKGVKGVTRVDDNIIIEWLTRERPDWEITEEIEQKLRWDVLVDDALINVMVEEGHVELSGTVGSAGEKRAAYVDAWVPGVEDVDHSDLEVQWWMEEEDLRGNKYVDKSDGAIKQAIEDAALYDPRVSSFAIEPVVDQGMVTLEGTVTSLQAKWAAEELARNTVGVSGVINEIDVTLYDKTDAEIADEIGDALDRNPVTDMYEIGVEVDEGKAILTGIVDYIYQKLEAEEVANQVFGVVSVDNQLEVENAPGAYIWDPFVDPYIPVWARVPTEQVWDDAEIEENIKDQLLWDPVADLYEIDVMVENGRATLTGTVDTWLEYFAAARNAYQGGAVRVDNNLEVE